jgi:hypothetical protein
MQPTKHMKERMVQRNFSPTMVEAIIGMGNWNQRGDRFVFDARQETEITELMTQIRRQIKSLDRRFKELGRLRKKGRTTVVTKEERLVTVFQNTKREKT